MALDYTWLTSVDDLYPHPGRVRVTIDEARALLVDDRQFANSSSRPRLWDGLEEYIGRFLALEERHASLLDGRELLKCLWLAGSFVSGKVEPNNIDVTVCLDDEARVALKGKSGSGWLARAFQRQACKQQFGVSPLELRYRRVVSVFHTRVTDAADKAYLQDRGGWDEWWQRCRDPGAATGEPTVATVETRRGYLEVVL
ncbi:DUF6932 family protein [Nocardioides bruguierae]|uniref:DUF6932 family protein n=1 Tax=Nocardioides bruguierae TaxID=2945102 RepID=UPI0020220796|nr:hypothetical protein [Nocardioides bruguierae]MCL8026079.1 hypothetical protein [Nocardioides bruguierae]